MNCQGSETNIRSEYWSRLTSISRLELTLMFEISKCAKKLEFEYFDSAVTLPDACRGHNANQKLDTEILSNTPQEIIPPSLLKMSGNKCGLTWFA